jgi:hypothetical protein
VETRAESLYCLALRYRRDRRFEEAAARWRDLLSLTDVPARRRDRLLGTLRACAVEALAIHHEHRARDLAAARELALGALEVDAARAAGDAARTLAMRHRLARLDRKLAKKKTAQLFS